MSVPTFPPEPPTETEQDLVTAWRHDPALEADLIAASNADLHTATGLLEQGCSVQTALNILL